MIKSLAVVQAADISESEILHSEKTEDMCCIKKKKGKEYIKLQQNPEISADETLIRRNVWTLKNYAYVLALTLLFVFIIFNLGRLLPMHESDDGAGSEASMTKEENDKVFWNTSRLSRSGGVIKVSLYHDTRWSFWNEDLPQFEQYIHLTQMMLHCENYRNQTVEMQFSDDLMSSDISVVETMVSLRQEYHDELLKFKNLGGKRLFWFSHEAPWVDTTRNDESKMSKFDGCISYRRDCTAFYPYEAISADEYAALISDEFDVEAEFNRRSKAAVFLYKDCRPPRAAYVEHFMEKYTVDSYGPCLNNKPNELSPRADRGSCGVAGNYMFYFAIENSVYTDYITEKLAYAIRCGCIPIVFSHNNVPDYRLRLPKGSYIDISDFSTVEDLANTMQEISNNLALYSSYFQFRIEHKDETVSFWQHVTFPRPTVESMLCDLVFGASSPWVYEKEDRSLLEHI